MTDASVATRIDAPRPIFLLPPLAWIVLAIGLIAAILAVKTGLLHMMRWLLNRPEYSHGLVIPFIAAFLIWQRRDQIERTPFTGSWAGLVWRCWAPPWRPSAKCRRCSPSNITRHSSLYWAGPGTHRLACLPAVVGPAADLVLHGAITEFLYQNVSAAFQLLSSQIGVWFIRLFGVTVYLEGNVIDLGVYKLQVAEACSGLRYLFALMTIGFLIAYLFKTALWKRGLLFLSSIPIAILMNSFRVGTIGVMVEHWGVGMAEGFLHEFQGWAVFMASGAHHAARNGAARTRRRASGPWREQFGLEFPAPTPKSPPVTWRRVPTTLYASTAALIVVASASLSMPERAESIPQRQSFVQFPNRRAPGPPTVWLWKLSM